VNAVTEGIRAELIAKGVPPDDILFLPNGVDTDRFSPQRGDSAVRVELGLPTGPLLAFTGTVGFAQGLNAVVDAMATVQDLPVQLAIVGDGSARAELVQRAASAGLSSIHFVDPVPPESIARLLPGCLAGVVSLADLATNQGARPSKLFPVMASGIPVLYCGTGEGAQLVERAAAGIAVGNASAPIADAIRRLSTRDDERGAYGRGGRAFVLAEMSWTRLVGDWLQELDVRLTTRSTRTKKRRSPHA